MNELSLFTGAGGGIYASLLLGWRTIGYVEWDDYCQRVIAQRQRDGIFHEAPIFGDIRQFLQSGAADQYRGFVDVVSGGFPCQPFSIAGKRAGADDHRNMWPATIECIRRVQPRYAFLENVPGLLTSGYFGTILGDLAEGGYDARWRVLSAAEVGAPHKRDRLWIVAHTPGERLERAKLQRRRFDLDAFSTDDLAGIPQSYPRRAHHGVADWKHRLAAIGNGQVPLVAATAWHLLTEGLTE